MLERIKIKPIEKPTKIKPGTERGELVDFFFKACVFTWNANLYGKLSFGRMLKKLEGLSTADLRYMRSIFLDSDRRRGRDAAVKEFFWSINPNKHTEV